MSHQSLMAVWSQLEERTDLVTTLRDAFGQYVAQVAACGKDPVALGSLKAFNRLINIVHVVFHLQRIYLQPRQPSLNVQLYLIEPDVVVEILLTLLTIKNDFLSSREDVHNVRESALRSIGAVVLAGLRLLTIRKTKDIIAERQDWASKVGLIQSKLGDWPLDSSVQRSLVGEVYIFLLEELGHPAGNPPLTHNSNASCSQHHEPRAFTADDLDLPSYEDGLYPLKVELQEVLTNITNCIKVQCPYWFQSFCIWYDLWSALIGAHIKKWTSNESTAVDSIVDFYDRYVHEAAILESTEYCSRFAVIKETLFALHPFPQCSADQCACFGHNLHHEYQEPQFPGIWQPSSSRLIELHHQIAADLEKRKRTLRDADGHMNKISENVKESIRVWTKCRDEPALDLGQIKTYVVNCPEMHPLTSFILKELFNDTSQEYAIEEIEKDTPQIRVDAIKCPTCSQFNFTQARLIEPLQILDQKLKAASYRSSQSASHLPSEAASYYPSNAGTQPPIPREYIQAQWSTTSRRSQQFTSSHPHLRAIRDSFIYHSRKGSSDDASQNSSKGKSSSKSKSDSTTPKVHFRYELFTDGKFVLVFTSHRISCYDCELMSWSRGHFFLKILMAAGSCIRYAVLSEEPRGSKLSVFRRNSILEDEEWSKDYLWSRDGLKEQPLSLAVSLKGDKVAIGFVSSVHIFDGATGGNLARLDPAMPRDIGINSGVMKTQIMSFSGCGAYLVIATREWQDGKTYIKMYDFPPQERDAEAFMVKVPSALSGDLGLSAIVYEPNTSTICFCSCTAKGKTILRKTNTHDVTQQNIIIRKKDFHPFPGDQIQCATVVPARLPQLVMVNDENGIFVLQYRDGRWKPYSVNVDLDHARKGVIRVDDKMSIAAMDNQVRLFWIQGHEGRLLTFDPDQLDRNHPLRPDTVRGHAAVLGSD